MKENLTPLLGKMVDISIGLTKTHATTGFLMVAAGDSYIVKSPTGYFELAFRASDVRELKIPHSGRAEIILFEKKG